MKSLLGQLGDHLSRQFVRLADDHNLTAGGQRNSGTRQSGIKIDRLENTPIDTVSRATS